MVGKDLDLKNFIWEVTFFSKIEGSEQLRQDRIFIKGEDVAKIVAIAKTKDIIIESIISIKKIGVLA